VRIELSQTGGIGYFPGLSKPAAVEVERLDNEAAEALKRLIEVTHFFDLPAEVGTPAKGAADCQLLILTITEDERCRTVRLLPPIADPALCELVQRVQKHIKELRAASRVAPGKSQ